MKKWKKMFSGVWLVFTLKHYRFVFVLAVASMFLIERLIAWRDDTETLRDKLNSQLNVHELNVEHQHNYPSFYNMRLQWTHAAHWTRDAWLLINISKDNLLG